MGASPSPPSLLFLQLPCLQITRFQLPASREGGGWGQRGPGLLTQASLVVPWPQQRALLPLFCPHDSSLSAFPLCDSGPWGGGLWTRRPLKGKGAENQMLGTSCSGEGGSPLMGVGGDAIPCLALAKVTRGVPSPLNWQPPSPDLREPSTGPFPHSPQEVLAELLMAMKRLKPFSYSFHPGAPFDSEQAGRMPP